MVTLVEEPVDVAAMFRGGKPVSPPGRCRRNAVSLGGTSGRRPFALSHGRPGDPGWFPEREAAGREVAPELAAPGRRSSRW